MFPISQLVGTYTNFNHFASPHEPVTMRSMTHTSADTLNTVSPTTLPPSSPNIVHIPNNNILLPRDTFTPPHPYPALRIPRQHSFFSIQNDLSLFSPQSRHRVTRAIQNSWANSTFKRYSGSIQQFIRFCDAEGVPDRLRFPADEFVLCAFAASSVGIHARSTPRNRLTAL